MKKLSCGDLDFIENDGFEASGNTDREVIEEMKHHMRLHHPHVLQDMPEDKLDEILGAKIREIGDQGQTV